VPVENYDTLSFDSNCICSSHKLITLGNVDVSDTLGSALHLAALKGKLKALKKVLDKGKLHILIIKWCSC